MAQTFAAKLLLAKTEAVEGTDPGDLLPETAENPSKPADAMLTSGLTLTPVQGDRLERNLDGASVGNDLVRLANKRMNLRFSVELAAPKSAGDSPGLATLLKSCGMAETLMANTSAIYTPRSQGIPSATLHFYSGNDLFKFTSCRGTWGLEFPGSGYPRFTFDMQGAVDVPEHVNAVPAANFGNFPDPTISSKANTPVATLDGTGVILREFTYAHGLQLVSVDVPNFAGTRIPDRAPTSAITIEEPLLSAKNFFEKAAAADPKAAFALTHGAADGRRVEFTMPAAQILEDITEVDLDGVKGLRMNLNPIATDAGNDEVAIAWK